MDNVKIYITVILILTILTGLLTGCGVTSMNRTNGIRINPSLSVPASPTVKKYEKDIEWLSFSFTDYEEERELVRKYRIRDIAAAETMPLDYHYKLRIAVAKADINGDSKQDIIFILVHRYFIGSATSGKFGILVSDGDDMQYISLPYMLVDSLYKGRKIENGQRNLGILNNPLSQIKDFYINGNLWQWSGKSYFWSSKIIIESNPSGFLANFKEKNIPVSPPIEKYEKDIEWLSFSFTDYKEERELVRKYFAVDIVRANSLPSHFKVKIAIAKADINGDSKPDIIFILTGSSAFESYEKAKTGEFGILVSDGDDMKYVILPYTKMGISFNRQNKIGVLNNSKSKWKDFYITGNLWQWSKGKYFWMSKMKIQPNP